MKRLFRILLSQNSLRKVLGVTNFFRATKFDHHLEVVERLDQSAGKKQILVLAPHPDDDIFGCGGTLKKFIDLGNEVTVAYFCDGSGGGEDGSKPDKTLVEVRKNEAIAAGKVLGFKKQVFFGYPDGRLAAGEASVRAASDLIKEVQPDIIFVPSFLDNHPDHRVVNEILLNAMVKIKINAQIYAYEVWTTIFPNRIILINDVLSAKKEAIEKHKSQLMFRSYDRAILGLNEYRAAINNKSGAAEAFFVTTPEIYKELYKRS